MTDASKDIGKADYAILGGGMAGLTMASTLLRRIEPESSVVVVEPRTEYTHDRTFCFWNVAPVDADCVVEHRWFRWSVRAGGKTHVAESDGYAYCYVPGDEFYKNTVDAIDWAPQAKLELGTRAGEITQNDDGTHRIQTDTGEIDAKWVFDTRPSPSLVESSTTLQHFVGWHVRFEEPIFDPQTVTLMDFDVPQDHGLHFMYVLPFSRYEAMVESTFFSAQVLPEATYEGYIRDYLRERLNVTDEQLERAEVVRVERGVVPMTPSQMVEPEPEGWHLLGTPGGFVRAATGYCFHATGRWALNNLEWLEEPNGKRPPVRSSRLAWLDSVLLGYLEREPERAPEIFLQLFERVPADALVRFLSDVGTVSDAFAVMRAMPAWPFIKEAMRRGFTSPVEVREPLVGSLEES